MKRNVDIKSLYFVKKDQKDNNIYYFNYLLIIEKFFIDFIKIEIYYRYYKETFLFKIKLYKYLRVDYIKKSK